MKKIILTLGILVGLGLTAAGGFYGGMQYQRKQAEQITANFFANRPGGQPGQNGQSPNGEFFFQPGGQQGNGFQGFARNGTVGTIKSIEGNVITLSTARNVTTVTLLDTSQINKAVSGQVSDLQPGMRVSVMGPADTEGKIEANTITILPEETTQIP